MIKYLPLIWAGLWRKPLRTSLTTLALIVAFMLFGLLQGINAGLNVLLDTARMDRLFVNPRFGAPMPLAYKTRIAQMPGVKRVIGQAFLGGNIGGDAKRQFFVIMCEDGFFDFNSEFNVTQAQLADLRANRTAFIASKADADRLGIKVGDHVTLRSTPRKDGGSDWQFDLIAVVDRDDLPHVVAISVGNFAYLDEERATDRGTINRFMVLMSDPNVAVTTARAIDAMFLNSGVPTYTTVERLAQAQGQADNSVPTMVDAIVLATFFSLLLMTGNTMMQSFRERIPEFGTLKALGFDDRQVLALVLAEAAVQCLGGAIVGLALARLALPYAKHLLSPGPGVFMTFQWSLAGLGLLVACGVAIVSAAAPAWRAGRMQIVNALAVK